MIRKSDRERSFGFTNVNVTALLTNDGIDEVSASTCEGGSDFVSLATGSHNRLSVEDILASLTAGSVAWSHTWEGSLRIFRSNQVARKVLVATPRSYGHVVENILSALMLTKDAVILDDDVANSSIDGMECHYQRKTVHP